VSPSRPHDSWAKAWEERYPTPPEPKVSLRARLGRRYGRGPWLLASVLALAALLVPAFAIAQGGGGQTFTSSKRYTLLARNSGSGGATAQTCNTSPGQQACENNVNFGTNYAATYRTKGTTAAYFQTSGSGTATPFQLSPNGTGEIQYLNADTVGGLQETQIFANYQQVSSTSASSTKGLGQATSESVTCPSGYNLVSANGAVNQSGGSNGGQAVIQGIVPSGDNKATVNAVTTGPHDTSDSVGESAATYTLTAWAVCATV
jgi:hypothetical protein